MRRLLVSSFVLALAACSPPASQGDASDAPSAGSTPATVAAQQLRVGRWKQVMTYMGQQTTTADCVTTSDLDKLAHDPESSCTSANGFQATPAGLVYEAECTNDQGSGHVRTVLSGDLQNQYLVEMTYSQTTGGGPGPTAMQIRIEGTYDGTCHGDE